MIKPYLDSDNVDTRFGLDPDDWELGVCNDEEVPIQFMAGPLEDEETFSDGASCYGWLEEVLGTLEVPDGYELEIGSAENLHSVFLKGNQWDTPEDDQTAIDFVNKCIRKLVECGAKRI